jgi:GNAT superfamily N-acetyltransferase
MIQLLRTDSNNQDFINLVKLLDSYLKVIDGKEHKFYNQFNKTDTLKNVVIAYQAKKAIGCGVFKKLNNNSVEIKRMFTLPETRGKGIATKILEALEIWAKELTYKSCVLETGKRMNYAVNFYSKNNYNLIPNYGQYKDVENSMCFKKEL